MPGYLLPRDLEGYLGSIPKEGVSLAMWLKYSPPVQLLASEGTLIQAIDRRSGKVTETRIPTLVPRSKKDGSCVHYMDDGRCFIHKHSPTGCKMFNACAVGGDAEKQDNLAYDCQVELMRTWVNYTEEKASDEEKAYCNLWVHLWDEGKRRENTTELTIKYQEGLKA